MRADVKSLVFFSTIAVYGDNKGQILTRRHAAATRHILRPDQAGRREDFLLAHGGDGQPWGVVLRMDGVYDSHIKGNYRRLLQALVRGHFIPLGSGQNRCIFVYNRDVAGLHYWLLSFPQATSYVYNVNDGRFHAIDAILETFCEALGRTPPHLGVLDVPARVVSTDGIRQRFLRRPLNIRTAIDKYTEDVADDGRRIQEELGFVPYYDLTTGRSESRQDMR